MFRLSLGILTLSLVTLSIGCALCCAPNDYHYPTHGGRYERVDPEWGRVGSILSDPNSGYVTPAPDRSTESTLLDEDADDLNDQVPEQLEPPKRDPNEATKPNNTRRRVQRPFNRWR